MWKVWLGASAAFWREDCRGMMEEGWRLAFSASEWRPRRPRNLCHNHGCNYSHHHQRIISRTRLFAKLQVHFQPGPSASDLANL
jgi:hypothetical protein